MKESLYYPIVFLLCHLIGDFITQTDWMALNKSKKSLNCFIHVIIYTAGFLILTTSWKALLFIGATHFIFDRWPVIIRRMLWLKNHFPTGYYPSWEYCSSTGYYDDSPYNLKKLEGMDKEIMMDDRIWGKPRHFFITIWLYIITDNTLHLVCNFVALYFLIK